MKYLMLALLTLGSLNTLSAYEEHSSISQTAINRIYDYYKGKGQAVYVVEYNGVNGISSIVSPSITNLSDFRSKALKLFKEGKGVKFPSGAVVLAFDAQGNLIDLTSFVNQ
jgi:hypothetical protein